MDLENSVLVLWSDGAGSFCCSGVDHPFLEQTYVVSEITLAAAAGPWVCLRLLHCVSATFSFLSNSVLKYWRGKSLRFKWDLGNHHVYGGVYFYCSLISIIWGILCQLFSGSTKIGIPKFAVIVPFLRGCAYWNMWSVHFNHCIIFIYLYL